MVYGGHFKVSYMVPQSVKKLKVKPKATWPERIDRSKFVGFSLPFPLEMERTRVWMWIKDKTAILANLISFGKLWWYLYKAKPLRIRCISQVKLGQAQTGQTISKARPRVALNKKSENSQSLDRPSDLTQGANTILNKHLAKILAYGTAYGAVHACVIGTVLRPY